MVVVDADKELDISGMKRGMEGLIKEIIKSIETYDARMVRSGIMYTYLMKYISQNTNVKVLLSGEGVEELCGHKEFNGLDDTKMQEKSVKLIKHLSKFEMLVGDKISGAYGLECRYPFLDERFVRYMLKLHPRLKRPQAYKYKSLPIEKYIIRKAFDDNNNEVEYLSDDLLWERARKDRDDGMIERMINELMDRLYTDGQFYSFMATNNSRALKKITSKEEMHYRLVFEALFGGNIGGVVPKMWDELWQ
jgi:asparagine synthase (glutamine-hydrolysing)